MPVLGPLGRAAAALLPAASFTNGLVLGAAAVYLLTNEEAQRTLIRGVLRARRALEDAIAELHERIEDAGAELDAEAREAVNRASTG